MALVTIETVDHDPDEDREHDLCQHHSSDYKLGGSFGQRHYPCRAAARADRGPPAAVNHALVRMDERAAVAFFAGPVEVEVAKSAARLFLFLQALSRTFGPDALQASGPQVQALPALGICAFTRIYLVGAQEQVHPRRVY